MTDTCTPEGSTQDEATAAPVKLTVRVVRRRKSKAKEKQVMDHSFEAVERSMTTRELCNAVREVLRQKGNKFDGDELLVIHPAPAHMEHLHGRALRPETAIKDWLHPSEGHVELKVVVGKVEDVHYVPDKVELTRTPDLTNVQVIVVKCKDRLKCDDCQESTIGDPVEAIKDLCSERDAHHVCIQYSWKGERMRGHVLCFFHPLGRGSPVTEWKHLDQVPRDNDRMSICRHVVQRAQKAMKRAVADGIHSGGLPTEDEINKQLLPEVTKAVFGICGEPGAHDWGKPAHDKLDQARQRVGSVRGRDCCIAMLGPLRAGKSSFGNQLSMEQEDRHSGPFYVGESNLRSVTNFPQYIEYGKELSVSLCLWNGNDSEEEAMYCELASIIAKGAHAEQFGCDSAWDKMAQAHPAAVLLKSTRDVPLLLTSGQLSKDVVWPHSFSKGKAPVTITNVGELVHNFMVSVATSGTAVADVGGAHNHGNRILMNRSWSRAAIRYIKVRGPFPGLAVKERAVTLVDLPGFGDSDAEKRRRLEFEMRLGSFDVFLNLNSGLMPSVTNMTGAFSDVKCVRSADKVPVFVALHKKMTLNSDMNETREQWRDILQKAMRESSVELSSLLGTAKGSVETGILSTSYALPREEMATKFRESIFQGIVQRVAQSDIRFVVSALSSALFFARQVCHTAKARKSKTLSGINRATASSLKKKATKAGTNWDIEIGQLDRAVRDVYRYDRRDPTQLDGTINGKDDFPQVLSPLIENAIDRVFKSLQRDFTGCVLSESASTDAYIANETRRKARSRIAAAPRVMQDEVLIDAGESDVIVVPDDDPQEHASLDLSSTLDSEADMECDSDGGESLFDQEVGDGWEADSNTRAAEQLVLTAVVGLLGNHVVMEWRGDIMREVGKRLDALPNDSDSMTPDKRAQAYVDLLRATLEQCAIRSKITALATRCASAIKDAIPRVQLKESAEKALTVCVAMYRAAMMRHASNAQAYQMAVHDPWADIQARENFMEEMRKVGRKADKRDVAVRPFKRKLSWNSPVLECSAFAVISLPITCERDIERKSLWHMNAKCNAAGATLCDWMLSDSPWAPHRSPHEIPEGTRRVRPVFMYSKVRERHPDAITASNMECPLAEEPEGDFPAEDFRRLFLDFDDKDAFGGSEYIVFLFVHEAQLPLYERELRRRNVDVRRIVFITLPLARMREKWVMDAMLLVASSLRLDTVWLLSHNVRHFSRVDRLLHAQRCPAWQVLELSERNVYQKLVCHPMYELVSQLKKCERKLCTWMASVRTANEVRESMATGVDPMQMFDKMSALRAEHDRKAAADFNRVEALNGSLFQFSEWVQSLPIPNSAEAPDSWEQLLNTDQWESKFDVRSCLLGELRRISCMTMVCLIPSLELKSRVQHAFPNMVDLTKGTTRSRQSALLNVWAMTTAGCWQMSARAFADAKKSERVRDLSDIRDPLRAPMTAYGQMGYTRGLGDVWDLHVSYRACDGIKVPTRPDGVQSVNDFRKPLRSAAMLDPRTLDNHVMSRPDHTKALRLMLAHEMEIASFEDNNAALQAVLKCMDVVVSPQQVRGEVGRWFVSNWEQFVDIPLMKEVADKPKDGVCKRRKHAKKWAKWHQKECNPLGLSFLVVWERWMMASKDPGSRRFKLIVCQQDEAARKKRDLVLSPNTSRRADVEDAKLFRVWQRKRAKKDASSPRKVNSPAVFVSCSKRHSDTQKRTWYALKKMPGSTKAPEGEKAKLARFREMLVMYKHSKLSTSLQWSSAEAHSATRQLVEHHFPTMQDDEGHPLLLKLLPLTADVNTIAEFLTAVCSWWKGSMGKREVPPYDEAVAEAWEHSLPGAVLKHELHFLAVWAAWKKSTIALLFANAEGNVWKLRMWGNKQEISYFVFKRSSTEWIVWMKGTHRPHLRCMLNPPSLSTARATSSTSPSDAGARAPTPPPRTLPKRSYEGKRGDERPSASKKRG